jgi:hypothetical protein
LPQACNEGHLCSQAGGGNRLVGAFTASSGHEIPSHHRLTAGRQLFNLHDKICIGAANYDQLGLHRYIVREKTKFDDLLAAQCSARFGLDNPKARKGMAYTPQQLAHGRPVFLARNMLNNSPFDHK